jgi:hypothetical protein
MTNYTLYVNIDNNNLSNDIKNYYRELEIYSGNTSLEMIIPHDMYFDKGVYSINHLISCKMINNMTGNITNYPIYPISTIYNYPFIHGVEIIGAGNREHIITKIRCIEPNVMVSQGIKLFKICSPDLSPFKIKLFN